MAVSLNDADRAYIRDIDAMVARARAAMRAVEHYEQRHVDRLCQALGWATANERTFGRIVAMSIQESGLGDPDGRNQKRMKKWVGLFLRYAGRSHYPKLWGIHNYGDTNYGRSTGTAFMLRSIAKKGEVWVTETGGIYEFKTQTGTVVFTPSASRQAKAETNAYKVAWKFGSRIKRLYYYQWRKNNAGDFFDAGIVDFGGALRPAYTSLKKLPKSVWM